MERGVDVDGERRGPRRTGRGDGRSHRLDHRGVVNQDVDRPELCFSPRCRLGYRFGIAEVGLEHRCVAALGSHGPRRFVELVGRACQQRHVGAAGDQVEGHRSSDAPAGSGHQGDPSLERCGHREATASSAARIWASSDRVV